jgi:hypothetical protein
MSLIKSDTLRKIIKEAVIRHLLSEIKKSSKDEDCKDCDKSDKSVSKSSKGGKSIGKKPYRGQKVDPMSLHTISGTSSGKSKSKSTVGGKKVDKSSVKSDEEPKEMKKFGGHYDDEAYDLNEIDDEFEEEEEFDDEFEDSEY